MSVDVNQRVINLESVLERFIENTSQGFDRVNKQAEITKKELASLSIEMKVFKDEMKAFKDEMKVFKDEMKAFKDEMKAFKDEMREQLKKMNKQWCELGNKMGALIEFIFFPGIGPTVERYFKTKLDTKGIHFFKRIKKLKLEGEFDIVATDPDRVYLVEVKSSPDKEKIKRFKQVIIPRFRKLYPEYNSKILIPIYGSLYFSDSLIKYASNLDIYLLAYKEWEYLDFLNFDQVNTA